MWYTMILSMATIHGILKSHEGISLLKRFQPHIVPSLPYAIVDDERLRRFVSARIWLEQPRTYCIVQIIDAAINIHVVMQTVGEDCIVVTTVATQDDMIQTYIDNALDWHIRTFPHLSISRQ